MSVCGLEVGYKRRNFQKNLITLITNMNTAICKLRYKNLKKENGVFVTNVEKVSLLFVDSDSLHTNLQDVDYNAIGEYVYNSDLEKGDYVFKNLMYDASNEKLRDLLKDAKCVLYNDRLDKIFLSHFVDTNEVKFIETK